MSEPPPPPHVRFSGSVLESGADWVPSLALRSCHWRHPRLPAALAQLGPGSEHRDGGVPGLPAEPPVTARRRDHPQEGGPAHEKQVTS